MPPLDGRIPATIRSPDAARASARLAWLLLEAGVVRECDVPRDRDDPLRICEAALRRWLERRLGPLRCCSPVFSMALEGAGKSGLADADSVCIRWGERQVLRWDVGGGLAWLERQTAGLGAAVLSVLAAQADALYPLFTPVTALGVASFLYWNGEDDEEQVLAECCETSEERDAMRAEMVTLAALHDAFPHWALAPPAMKDALALLRRVARDEAVLAVARRAAAQAVELAGLPARREYAPDAEGIFIGYGAVLCWRTDDLAMRISNDLAHYAWQDEHIEHAGEVRIALDDPASLRRWLCRMCPLLRGIVLLDTLIWTLVDGYCQQEKGG